MQSDVADRLEFVKIQIRGLERAFMGGGHVHATHDELDKIQISFSSHPCVLSAVKDVRSAMTEFLTTKINGRLDGETSNQYPISVWHAYNGMEQAIRRISVGAHEPRRVIAAA